MTPDHIDPNTACPHWCIADHSLFQDEDAHVHIGIDEHLTDQITLRLVASRNPHTGAMDGLYLLVNAPHLALDSHELEPDRARNIGMALIKVADRGAQKAVVLNLPGQRPLGPIA
jgi:hypothetical protein